MPFIFQNSSYVLAYQLSDSDFQKVGEFFTSKSVRSINFQSVEELKDSIHKIRFLTAFFIGADTPTDDERVIASILKELGFDLVQLCRVVTGSTTDPNQVDFSSDGSLHEVFESVLVRLVPTRLDELMTESINSLLPSYMADSNLKFSTSSRPVAFDDYDVMTVCHVAAEPFVGQGVEYVNIAKLVEVTPTLKGRNEVQLRDYAREMLNQFLGILNRHLLKLELVTSIGVPEQHEKDRVSSIRRTGPYLPTVQLYDDQGVFLFQLGFVHRDGKAILDLVNLDLNNGTDDDIDFF